MKKMILKSALLAVASVGLLAGGAMAIPVDDDYWTLTDFTTGSDGSTTSSTVMDMFFDTSSVGSFGLYYDINGDTVIDGSERFEVVTGVSGLTGFDAWISETTFFNYNSSDSVWELASEDVWAQDYVANGGTEQAQAFSNIFGFYFSDTLDPINYYYTDSAFNNGTEYIAIDYDPYTAVIAFDLGADNSIDALVKTTDVAPVPEPATMFLFGTGLAGLAGFSRKKSKKA